MVQFYITSKQRERERKQLISNERYISLDRNVVVFNDILSVN